MELGEAYNDKGEIYHEKLFYFHFRNLPNSIGFRGTDGNEMISEIAKEKKEIIKEEFVSRLYDEQNQIFHEIEKILVLQSEELFISNGNNLDYYFSNKRLHKDEELTKLYEKFRNL